VIKKLGVGCEGSVYLVAKAEGKTRCILKIFHEKSLDAVNNIHTAGFYSRDVGPSSEHLVRYSNANRERVAGMYPIDLVQGSANNALGVTYPYEKLRHVPVAVFRKYPNFHQALFTAFCRSQAFLLEKHGMGISDSAASNFMISSRGEFRFIDYGVMLIPVDDFRAREEGYLAKAFIDTLLIPVGRQTEHQGTVPLGQPYCQCDDSGLEEACKYSPWLSGIIEEVRGADAALFLDPEAYKKWAQLVSVDSVGAAATLSKIIMPEKYKATRRRIRRLVRPRMH